MIIYVCWPIFMTIWFMIQKIFQKSTEPHVLIVIMTSQLSQLMEWFKILNFEYLKNEAWLFYERKTKPKKKEKQLATILLAGLLSATNSVRVSQLTSERTMKLAICQATTRYPSLVVKSEKGRVSTMRQEIRKAHQSGSVT